MEYSVDSLAGSGLSTRTAAFALGATAGSLSHPAGLAFDTSGNLWVSNGTGNTVVEFVSGQLGGSHALPAATGVVSSGTPRPLRLLRARPTMVPAGALAATATPTPAVTIGASGGSLNAPLAIAFDTGGNLWVANANAGTVVAFTPTQLAASGTPSPAVILSAAAGSIVAPTGLAFDGNGNLWVANGNSTIVEFTGSQLTSSGSPTPNAVVRSSSPQHIPAGGIAFDPSANLPPFPDDE